MREAGEELKQEAWKEEEQPRLAGGKVKVEEWRVEVGGMEEEQEDDQEVKREAVGKVLQQRVEEVEERPDPRREWGGEGRRTELIELRRQVSGKELKLGGVMSALPKVDVLVLEEVGVRKRPGGAMGEPQVCGEEEESGALKQCGGTRKEQEEVGGEDFEGMEEEEGVGNGKRAGEERNRNKQTKRTRGRFIPIVVRQIPTLCFTLI